MPNLKRLRPLPDEPILIAYYCRPCESIVKAISKGGKKKYSFSCPECKRDCSYGTVRSLIHFLKIKEHSDNGKILLQMQEEKLQKIAAKQLQKDTKG
jgi:hypothetical protein